MTNNSNSYKLSEFAEKLNVSTKTLQRWDKSGILVAHRNDSNRRVYTDAHIEQYNNIAATNEALLSRRKHFKYKDLTGQVFGQLTVIERSDDFIARNGHRHIQWLCACACGQTKIIKGSSLSAGYNKSCGCSQYGDGDTKRMWAEYVTLKTSEQQATTTPKAKVGRKRKDLSGQVFGWLTAIEPGEDVVLNSGTSIPTWRCACKCGAELDVRSVKLTKGVQVSCGCMPREMRHKYRQAPKSNHNTLIDLTGQQFSFWSVIERAESKKYAKGGQTVRWLCECICGMQKVVPGRDLRSGSSQSCGCMTSMPWLEYHVMNYLNRKQIPHVRQISFPDLLGVGGKSLSYDFLITDSNGKPVACIECQGEQHFRPIRRFGGAKKLVEQQIHDRLKKEYAETTMGVPLYEVLYTCKTEAEIHKVLDTFSI